ncbi:MAG: hypothetical protein HY815_19345 [Candidatus Riflebacteria bacterium]|nr:hypothetical protein [Candidatus Riflebacteria bacterium]
MDKIAKALGAERLGRVHSSGGCFGAAELLEDIMQRFHVPAGGGRPTDPNWTQRRLVALAPETLNRLREIARDIGNARQMHLNAMQVAALLIERALAQVTDPLQLADHIDEPRPSRTGMKAASRRR